MKYSENMIKDAQDAYFKRLLEVQQRMREEGKFDDFHGVPTRFVQPQNKE